MTKELIKEWLSKQPDRHRAIRALAKVSAKLLRWRLEAMVAYGDPIEISGKELAADMEQLGDYRLHHLLNDAYADEE